MCEADAQSLAGKGDLTFPGTRSGSSSISDDMVLFKLLKLDFCLFSWLVAMSWLLLEGDGCWEEWGETVRFSVLQCLPKAPQA